MIQDSVTAGKINESGDFRRLGGWMCLNYRHKRK